ncbi:MAG: restriction endonuclease subunit M, partial [Candidatus Delongbacteria bacterium]|nr:restriction endonuclease subunit M [Candidatus Delongbacteria bacterium]
FSFVKKYLFPAFGDNESGGRIRLDANKMIKLPIKNIIPESKQPFIEKADVMLALNKELYSETDNFLSTLREEKHIEKIPSKFEKFYELSFESFKIELIKQKIDFTYGAETNRWREYFNSVTDKLKLIKAEIDKTDTEIDRMVYVLYGLTEEEIMIVEEGI